MLDSSEQTRSSADGMLPVQAYFRAPLVPLEGKYADVLTPEAELGKDKIGVSDFLLERAEEYFTQFANYTHIYHILMSEIQRLGLVVEGVAVDIGSGFGNTVIPLLQNHPRLSVLATDISPDLLAILCREARERGFHDRCAAVAMDAHADYFERDSVDLAFGNAVLHHLVDPAKVVSNVLAALRPGGRAIFCEPFQAGHAIQRMAYEQILAEARLKGEWSPAFDFLYALTRDIHVRSHQRVLPDTGMRWEELDDKWMFTRTHFERIAEVVGCSDLAVRAQYVRGDYLTGHTRVSLTLYGGLSESLLPAWAWEVLRRYDEDYLTPELRSELILEGIVTITR